MSLGKVFILDDFKTKHQGISIMVYGKDHIFYSLSMKFYLNLDKLNHPSISVVM